MYNQALQVASMITACDEKDAQVDFYSKQNAYTQEGKYYIAIASNQEIGQLDMSSVYLNVAGEYENMIQRIISLQKAEEERNVQ